MAETDAALPGPEGHRPSAQSRRLARIMRLVTRPLAGVLPANRFGLAVVRWLILLLTRPLRAMRGARVEQVVARFGDEQFSGEWVRARGVRRDDAAILYLHGSGYVSCSPRTHRGLVARLSALTGLPVFSLDYRLAPDHPFPAAADDTLAAYRWLLAEGFAPERLVVGGDSAGGHLALGLAVWLRQEDLPPPAGLVMFSPLVDDTFELCAARDRECRDPLFPNATGRRLVALYSGAADRTDPRLALLECDAASLPPMLVQAGGLEMLAADAERLCELVETAGGSCELQVWPGQIHVFQIAWPLIPEGDLALRHAARFVGERVDAAATATATATAAG